MIEIKRGLDIPLAGSPQPSVSYGPAVLAVGLVGDDYVGLKPAFSVREGDRVALGQELFADRQTSGVRFTSPAAGRVAAIHRGERRVFQSLVIELDGDEQREFAISNRGAMTRERVTDDLLASGLWTALRTRPYNRVPDPQRVPRSIFVTAMDTNPLAADPALVIAAAEADFQLGLHALTHLTDGPVRVCHRAGSRIPAAEIDRVSLHGFGGPHPAGLPGTHIHFLDPVGPDRQVWFVGYQDVIAFGVLFRSGRLSVERVVALAGPSVKRPRLVRTRLGARIDELVNGELKDGEHRVLSGSALSGRQAKSPLNFLGRYHQQLTVLEEGRQREFLGWQAPGRNKFSVTRAFASAWLGKRELPLNTNLGGSPRAMVPIGVYERVVPLDVLPTQLLRALLVGDTEQAQALGCLELDEEDLALCTFVCPSKHEYGPLLREALGQIESEG